MFVVEVVELSWPVLGAMLALWANLGGSLGPGRGLCWPILGPMLTHFGPKNGSKRRWPKNTQKMAQKRSRQRPAGRPGARRAASEGLKTVHSWHPQKRRWLTSEHASKTHRQRHTKPVSCCPQPEIALSRSTLAHLGAMLARLESHVGPSWRLRWRHVG